MLLFVLCMFNKLCTLFCIWYIFKCWICINLSSTQILINIKMIKLTHFLGSNMRQSARRF